MIRSPRESDFVPNTPLSPLGMTTGPSGPRSSKSSSFQSSLRSDEGSLGGDISHFEDIGLEDDATITSSSQLSLHRSRAPSPSPPSPLPNGHNGGGFPNGAPLSHSLSHGKGSSNGNATANGGGGRTLAAGSRGPKPQSSSPNLRSSLQSSNPRSTSLTVLTDSGRPISPSRRKTNRSTPSLLLSSHRQRSPSPNMALNPRGPTLPQRPRRGSWQSNTRERKSIGELEHDFEEDEDDDIPDGLILDNVPISPRPQRERPPSRAPSVSRSPDRHKERVRSVGNGTPAIAQAQGSLKSPTWKQDAENAERPPPTPAKVRANSWNAGFAELNAEARALTEKLEQHADEEERFRPPPSPSGRPNTWNSSQMPADYAYDRKSRIKSTPELPPLRRTNVMIDPLPVSKEKEAVLSRTRPSWLPPKDPAEEKRHVRQYQQMMAASAKADERREAARRSKAELRDADTTSQMQIWEKEVYPRWDDAIRERRTRELWWRGIPPRSRGLIWSRAIGNELGLSDASYTAALARAHEIEQRVREGRATAEDTRRARWFEEIQQDVSTRTWHDLRIFDTEGPLHHGLVDVLMAYSMYRNDIGYIPGCNTIAALLILNLPNNASTFIALANTLNRSLPLSFHMSDAGGQSSAYNVVLQTLRLKSPKLHDHLTKEVPDLEPGMYLHGVFVSLFTGQLAIDEASRLWDVYIFEGDALLVRAAVAFLLRVEMALLGSWTLQEVQAALASRPSGNTKVPAVTEVGAEDDFMKAVRDAGKKD